MSNNLQFTFHRISSDSAFPMIGFYFQQIPEKFLKFVAKSRQVVLELPGSDGRKRKDG